MVPWRTRYPLIVIVVIVIVVIVIIVIVIVVIVIVIVIVVIAIVVIARYPLSRCRQKGPWAEVTFVLVPSGALQGKTKVLILIGGVSPRGPHRDKHSGHFSLGAL